MGIHGCVSICKCGDTHTVGISSDAFQRKEVFVGQERICLASVEIFALAEGLGGDNQVVPQILCCWTSPV